MIFRTVLMDTWYAIAKLMCWIDGLGYRFVCLICHNRQVLDHWTQPEKPTDRAVEELPWNQETLSKNGLTTKLRITEK